MKSYKFQHTAFIKHLLVVRDMHIVQGVKVDSVFRVSNHLTALLGYLNILLGVLDFIVVFSKNVLAF